MIKFFKFILLSCLSLFTFYPMQAQNGLKYIMDMVHNNPGEKPFVTKYNEGPFLRSQGYNGIITHWYVNCAITYDQFEKNIVKKKTAERMWIEKKRKSILGKLDSLKRAGLCVYPFTDFLVFPKSIWDKYGDQISGVGQVATDAASGKRARKVNIENPLTQRLLRAQISEIFDAFPQIDGLVVRFGETYLQDTPYHLGGSPISDKNAIQDHILFLKILREEVCVKRNKKLFYRTWDFGYNFHCNSDFYLQVTNSIEPHPNLLFAIKYQQGDFHRNCQFNPTIGIGRHHQIIESQSRMEAYGKGAHPYYTASGVINGWPETKYEIDWAKFRVTRQLRSKKKPRGLRDILHTGIVDGIMTWSNGGGWQGPYIKNEIWTDLNCYVLSRWAQDTSKSEKELFYQFAKEKGFDSWNSDIFRKIAMLSIEAVRMGQLNSYSSNQVWWTRDEFFSATDNREVIKEIHEKNLERLVLEEKKEAVAMWEQIEALANQLDCSDSILIEAIRTSCTYGRIKYQLIEQMWIMMLNYSPGRQIPFNKVSLLKTSIDRYDELWKEWRDLYHTHALCATIYTDKAFRNKKEGSIGEFCEKLRMSLLSIQQKNSSSVQSTQCVYSASN